MSGERHIVHCKSGGKVVLDGDQVEIHLPGPIVIRRSKWIKYFTPKEEARRALDYAATTQANLMLEEAFTAVPMVVHDDD